MMRGRERVGVGVGEEGVGVGGGGGGGGGGGAQAWACMCTGGEDMRAWQNRGCIEAPSAWPNMGTSSVIIRSRQRSGSRSEAFAPSTASKIST